MAGLHSDKSKEKDRGRKDRAFSHGSGWAAADAAVEGRPRLEDRHIETPPSRKAKHVLRDAAGDRNPPFLLRDLRDSARTLFLRAETRRRGGKEEPGFQPSPE